MAAQQYARHLARTAFCSGLVPSLSTSSSIAPNALNVRGLTRAQVAALQALGAVGGENVAPLS